MPHGQLSIINDDLESDIRRMRFVCNVTVLSQAPPTDGLYCPAEFDGWTCLNYTKAGTTGHAKCPIFFETDELAHRYCESNGTWQIHPDSGSPWTNLTACHNNKTRPSTDVEHHMFTDIYLFLAGAALSMVLLILSLIIFFGFRQLRCDRITIHKNLFISYFFSALTWSIYYKAVVLDGEVVLTNPGWCRVLNLIAQYFSTTNFSWMFCEGLYLHFILARALRTGKKLIKCLIIAGWTIPFILTVIYGVVRNAQVLPLVLSSNRCWSFDDDSLYIISVPIMVSTLTNICMLINIVRLLMTKLRQIPDVNQSRKAAKAILILVPLFGMQWLLFPVRPEQDSVLHDIYVHFAAVIISIQGTLVSIIFCFCNGEVRSLIRRKWHEHRLMNSKRRPPGITSTTYIDGYSIVDSTREVTYLRSKNNTEPHNKPTENIEFKCTPHVFTPLVEKDGNQKKTDLKFSEIEDV
ncbi:unnamed protein product [Lymnaea stagnalis]|uniref:Calcitonin receptor n=1 Tax=Lymnaea stagnalis TaxID=6523 RepID=A0AAV2HIA3_LYMST